MKNENAHTSIKILLVDDHMGFRKLLSAYLTIHDNIEVIGIACDGYEAVRQTGQLQPDIVLMDIAMPNYNGIRAAKDIKKQWPMVKVVLMSMDPDEFYRRQVQQCADGFIVKTSMKKTLLAVLAKEKKLGEKSFSAQVAAA